MVLYGSLDMLLAYSPSKTNQVIKKRGDGDGDSEQGSLENLLSDKLNSFRTILTDVTSDIDKRRALSEDIINRIYQHYIYIKTNLMELYTVQIGSSFTFDFRRSSLEKQLDSLKHEKRAEQITCSQDIAKLKIEFRQWFKKYSDLLQRIKIIIPDGKSSNKKSLNRNSDIHLNKFFLPTEKQ